jgi:hypothetical protein
VLTDVRQGPPSVASKIGASEHCTRAPLLTSAYRSEVAGLFGIATMVREICALHDITAGTVYLVVTVSPLTELYRHRLRC